MMNIQSRHMFWSWLIIATILQGSFHCTMACEITNPSGNPPISYKTSGTGDRSTIECYNCSGARISNCQNVLCATGGACVGTVVINVKYLLCSSFNQATCQGMRWDVQPCVHCVGVGCPGTLPGRYGDTCGAVFPNYCIVAGPSSLSYNVIETNGGSTVECNPCNSATILNCDNVLCNGDALCLNIAFINVYYLRCSSPNVQTCSGTNFGPFCIHCLGLGCLNANEVGYIPRNGGTCDIAPSAMPSVKPSQAPTVSSKPSRSPSAKPSVFPSLKPSQKPSRKPSAIPSSKPSSLPSVTPSRFPSVIPSKMPSNHPSAVPSKMPSTHPSGMPSKTPSTHPSAIPSKTPSTHPSAIPSKMPSTHPSAVPSKMPSNHPSASQMPSTRPSAIPSFRPSLTPVVSTVGAPAKNPFPWIFYSLLASGALVTGMLGCLHLLG